jgi:hypothetical protein
MIGKECVFSTVQKVTHDDIRETEKEKLLKSHSEASLIFKQRTVGKKKKEGEE